MVMCPGFPCVCGVRWSVCLSLGESLNVCGFESRSVPVCESECSCITGCLIWCARMAGVSMVRLQPNLRTVCVQVSESKTWSWCV